MLRLTGRHALAVMLGLLLAGGAAQACRCIEPGPAAAYRGADAVVTAQVLQVTGDPEGPGGAVARLVVDRSWKAALAGEIEVATASTCAYPFAAGQGVLVYLQRAQGSTAWTSARCRGNRPLDNAAPALQWLQRHGRSAASAPAR